MLSERSQNMKTISLVTPCFNEEAGIRECYEGCRNVMEGELADYAYEHIFIDNCSTDRTVAVLKEIAAQDKRVKIIVNARNFGPGRSPHHAMLVAGGDAVVPILADLQTPPSILPEMARNWAAGSKIVIAVRRDSGEHGPTALARKAFYALIKRFSKVDRIPNYMGYGLYDRQVMDIVRSLNEPDPYFRGLVPEIGFERAVVEYGPPSRRHGRSRHGLLDLVDIALLGITTFSKAPMRLMTVSGFIVASLSLLAAFVYLCVKLMFWNSVPIGVGPILIATFFFGAVQLLALGLVGEYVGLLLQYARRFPLAEKRSESISIDAPGYDAGTFSHRAPALFQQFGNANDASHPAAVNCFDLGADSGFHFKRIDQHDPTRPLFEGVGTSHGRAKTSRPPCFLVSLSMKKAMRAGSK